MSKRAALWLWCACAFALGCGDDPTARNSAGFDLADGSVDDDDAGAADPADACRGADDGEPCDEGKHCIGERCIFNVCGDGVRAGAEQCDDGNAIVEDACDAACRVVPESCGDALIQAGEECDDGNRFDLDECSTACTENACGNARIDGQEECDDGNLVDDDGCSDLCTENRCRNGRLDPGEECDDGNRIHDDGCTNACVIVICGNGEAEVYEECDDGNDVDDDACSNACATNECGNRRIDPGELCDGDTLEAACSDDCQSLEENVCRPCEEKAETCANYMGSELDLVVGCLDGEPPAEYVPVLDPQFAQDCIDAVTCARQNQCFTEERLAIACYCGDKSTDDCQMTGPDANAPCVDEWTAATRATTNAQVLDSISDLGLPSGWAFYLLSCDLTYCADECLN